MLRMIIRVLLSWIWVMGIIKTVQAGIGYLIVYLLLSASFMWLVESRRER